MGRMDRHKSKTNIFDKARKSILKIKKQIQEKKQNKKTKPKKEKTHEQKELIVAWLALIISVIGLGYNIYVDFILDAEKIEFLFDKVYTEDYIELKKVDDFYTQGEGVKDGIIVPINCRIVVTNKSSKPISIIEVFISRPANSGVEIYGEYDFVTGFLNSLSIDNKIINNSTSILLNPYESKIVTVNMNYLLSKDVENIILEGIKMEENGIKNYNKETDSLEKIEDFRDGDTFTISSKILTEYLLDKQHSIFGKMVYKTANYRGHIIPVITIDENELPELYIRCKTSSGKNFSFESKFKDVDQMLY